MGNFFDNAGGAGDIMENFEKKILFTSFYRIITQFLWKLTMAYIWGISGRFDQAVTLTIFFPFKYVMDEHKKKTYTNFQIFLKISLAAMVEIVVKFGPLSSLLKLPP